MAAEIGYIVVAAEFAVDCSGAEIVDCSGTEIVDCSGVEIIDYSDHGG